MSNVVNLPVRGQRTLLSKKQLASKLGRSTRWIEQQVGRGMPVEPVTDRFGGRRYDLAEVEAWIADGKPKQPPVSVEQRLASLERQMSELLRRAG